MLILSIDPGPQQSAVLEWDGRTIRHHRIAPNETILCEDLQTSQADVLAVEQIKSYGMAVADSIFDTVFWSGRFVQACKLPLWVRVPRKDIKMHLCGSMRAKDSNIRQALIDRFGAPGTKKAPGICYGIKKDEWAAWALAVTWWDLKNG